MGSLFLEAGIHCIDQVGLELVEILLNAGIIGVDFPAWIRTALMTTE